MPEPKYTVYHSFKKPTQQYGNEEFGYTVRGDEMKEVIKDLQELKKAYPPLTHKEKVERAAKEDTSF